MPSIEYSPSGRAMCHGCCKKISKGSVRVGVRRSSGSFRGHMDFHSEYYHAGCYTGRTDFTKFFGWCTLKATDKRQFGPAITHITSIKGLSMRQERWKIQAQVESKSEIRHWQNARGSGSLFSVELLDASGVDIKATFFQDAVDKFYEVLQVGQTYNLCDGRLKAANKQYNTCKSNLEINFGADADIQLVEGAKKTIIEPSYGFCASIASLQETENGTTVNVVAVVADAESEVTTFTKADGPQLMRRHVTLLDSSNCSIQWTLWGAAATADPPAVGTVVDVFHTRLSDYGGVSLSGATHWKTSDNPQLQEWWEAHCETALLNAKSLTYVGQTPTKMQENKETDKDAEQTDEDAGKQGPTAPKRKLEEVEQEQSKQLKQSKTSENDAQPQAAA